MRDLPGQRHEAPMPAGRGAPFLLIRQLDGDVLISPFSRRASGPSPEETALSNTVALGLSRDLPVGCFWVDARDGTVTPATFAVSQLRRRMTDNAAFNVRRPWDREADKHP